MAGPTESTVPVGSSTTTSLVDSASLSSYQLNATVIRQLVGISDPQDAYGMASVVRFGPNGNEYAQVIRMAPGSPEVQDILRTGQQILAELQTLIIMLGGLPSTPLSVAGVSASPPLGTVS